MNSDGSYMCIVFQQQDGRHDAVGPPVLQWVRVTTTLTTEHFPVAGYQLRDDVMSQPLPVATVAWRRHKQTEKLDANHRVITTSAGS